MARIRVHNTTGIDLETVTVYAPTPEQRRIEFGALSSGSYSVYRDVPEVRRFARIDVTNGTATLSIQPFDLVGEAPLPAGEFTYELGMAGDRLILDVSDD